MVRIGIIGAAGLSGRELLYWLKNHPEAAIELLTSSKYQGRQVTDVFPELRCYSQVFQPNESDVSGCDLVFLAQFSQQKTQTNAAVSQFCVLVSCFNFWVVMTLNFWVFFMPQLMCNLFRF